MKKLNVGCGLDYRNRNDGWVNLDFNSDIKADVYHNLNVYPYPFENETFELIAASHVIEHLDYPYKFMKEMFRILKKDGEIVVYLPSDNYGIFHHRGRHEKDYFWALTNEKSNGQSEKLFKVVYEKPNIRSLKNMVFKYRNIFLNLVCDEWEYKLKKL